ncbi:MAG: hypothetical protein LUG83_06365 [Lachnospiraceae bacterium]|nr:hypothetical protein [Lachnospiraceae bacterium]
MHNINPVDGFVKYSMAAVVRGGALSEVYVQVETLRKAPVLSEVLSSLASAAFFS